MKTAHRISILTAAAAIVALLVAPLAAAHETPHAGMHKVTTEAPDGFKKVSELTELPEFMPGMGELWVDPDTLPVGPFLGYDHDGKLVNATLMVPLDAMKEHQDWTDRGAAFGDITVDHVDVTYNPGHSGVDDAHYHITLWSIPHDAEEARLGEHAHGHH